MTRGALGSTSSLRAAARPGTMLRSKISSCIRVACNNCSRVSGAAAGFEKGEQQGVLALAQRDRRAVGVGEFSATRSSSQPLNLYPPRSDRLPVRPVPISAARSTGPNAREQFPQAERLYDVIIRPQLKTDDAINLLGAMSGRDDDRNVRMRTNFPQEIQPVVLTEPQIQYDQAGLAPAKWRFQFGSVRRRLRRHIVILPGILVTICRNAGSSSTTTIWPASREHEMIFQIY